ncbi:hypothetical protein D3C85_1213910 [compost metagenome]
MWHFLHQSVQFGCRCLIEARGFLQAQDAHGLKQPQRADAIGIGRVLGLLEGNLHMALGSQIIDFRRLDLGDNAQEAARVRQIAMVQFHIGTTGMRIVEQVVDTVGVEKRSSAFDTVDLISLGKQKFGKISTVLPGDACNKCDFAHCCASFLKPGRKCLQSGRYRPLRDIPRTAPRS